MTDERRIAGKYVLLEELGRGGFGTVHRARHVDLHKDVALKLLNPELAQDEGAQKRFLREVENTTRFVHKFAVQLRDFGRDAERGALYYTMDLVEGPTLRKLLRAEGKLEERRAARLAAQVCEALAEAHDAGLVHRDLKPENLIVTRGPRGDEEIRVLDFGIAKAVSQSRDATSALTVAGQTVGTLAYMSPEQADGAKLDGRSDLYSLGVVLYEMLSGRRPIEPDPGSEDSVRSFLTRLLIRPPTDLRAVAPDVSRPFAEVIMRLLAKEPGQRLPDARALRAALLTFADALDDAPTPDPDALGAATTMPGLALGSQVGAPRAALDPGGSAPTIPGIAVPTPAPPDARSAAEDQNPTIPTPSARGALTPRGSAEPAASVVDLAAAAEEQAKRDRGRAALRETLPPRPNPFGLPPEPASAPRADGRGPLEPIPSKSRVGLVGFVLVLLLAMAGGVVVGMDLGGLGTRLRKVLASLDPIAKPDPMKPTPPALRLVDLSPATGAVLPGEAVTVQGRVDPRPPSSRSLEVVAGAETADVGPDGRFSCRVPTPAEGAYDLEVVVRDRSEPGVALATARLTVVCDRTPPTLHLDVPAPGATIRGTTMRVAGIANDPNGVTVTVCGQGATVDGNGGFALDLPVPPDGRVVVVARDAAGLEAREVRAVSVPAAGPPLAITIDAPGDASPTSDVEVRGRALAGSLAAVGQTIVVSRTPEPLPGGPVELTTGKDGSFKGVVRLPDGEHVLTFAAAGTAVRPIERRVRVDGAPPVVTLDLPLEGAPWASRVRVSGRVEEPYLDSLVVNGQRLIVASGAFDRQVDLVPSASEIVVVATDRGGRSTTVRRRLRGSGPQTPSTPGTRPQAPASDDGWRIVLESPAYDALLAEGAVHVAGRLVDAPAGPVELRIGGTPILVGADRTFARDLTLSTGRHELELAARVGASTARLSRPVTVLAPPAATGILPVDPAEPNDSAAQAKRLAPGLYPRIGLDGEDWYRVAVPAGCVLRASIAFDPAAGDIDLELRDVGGADVLAFSRGTGGTERVEARASEATELLLRAYNCRSVYALLLEAEPYVPADPLEPNDTAAEARAVGPGQWRGLLTDAADWYRLDVPPGKAVEVRLDFKHAEGDVDLQVVGASDQRVIRTSVGTSDVERVRTLVPPDGLLARVYGPWNRYDLTVTQSEPPPPDRFEPNDEPAAARPLAPGAYRGLTLDVADWYRVQVPAGQALKVHADGPEGEPFDLAIVDGERVLASATGAGALEATFNVATNAQLLVGVTGGVFTYGLTVELAPVQVTGRFEPNDRPADARRLPAGRYAGLECTGEDWYVLDLRAGDRLVVALDFQNAAGDLDLEVITVDGPALGSSAGTTDHEEVTATATGPTYVRVHHATGPYVMTVTVNGSSGFGKGQR